MLDSQSITRPEVQLLLRREVTAQADIRRSEPSDRYVAFMDADRQRATAVVTALLSRDAELARDLIEQDEDPHGLAFGAATLAAGMWDHHTRMMGKDPSEQWAKSLGTLATKERNN